MNVHSMFPSKFVAASDLMGQDVTVTVAGIKQEGVGAEEEIRPVLYFAGMTKGMVLNRTNAKRIAAIYGVDTDAWMGKPVTLYPSETEYAGETVPCIRVRQTVAAGPAAAPPAVVAAPAAPPAPAGVRF